MGCGGVEVCKGLGFRGGKGWVGMLMLTFEGEDGRRETGDGRRGARGTHQEGMVWCVSGVCARMVICR